MVTPADGYTKPAIPPALGSSGSMTISGCANYGDVTGERIVGGIVGYFYGADANSATALANAKYITVVCASGDGHTAGAARGADDATRAGAISECAALHIGSAAFTAVTTKARL